MVQVEAHSVRDLSIKPVDITDLYTEENSIKYNSAPTAKSII